MATLCGRSTDMHSLLESCPSAGARRRMIWVDELKTLAQLFGIANNDSAPVFCEFRLPALSPIAKLQVCFDHNRYSQSTWSLPVEWDTFLDKKLARSQLLDL